jgi:hypothetical protein
MARSHLKAHFVVLVFFGRFDDPLLRPAGRIGLGCLDGLDFVGCLVAFFESDSSATAGFVSRTVDRFLNCCAMPMKMASCTSAANFR